MKRYKFRFEPLLFQRATREEQVQQELAKESHKLEELNETLTALFAEYHRQENAKPNAALAPAELILAANYAALLRDRLDAAKAAVREQRKVVDEVLERLAKAHMDKEVVEKLKERDRSAYYDEMNKLETKQLDEMTIIRHASPALKKQN